MMNWKRSISLLLCMAMLLGNFPVVSFAAETDGLCEHHTEHLECGYVEGESACGYVCEICAQAIEETTEPPATEETKPVCTGLAECAAENHNEGCEKAAADAKAAEEEAARKAAEEKDAADKATADAVAAMIAALPALVDIQAKPYEEQGGDYTQVNAAYDAWKALTDEQKALLTCGQEFFDPYLLYFSGQTQEAAVYSGICGNNVNWSLDTDTGELFIWGSGAINFYSYNATSWSNYRSYIKTVNIGSGITGIGAAAFAYCNNLTSVTIPYSVTSIDAEAFNGCSKLSGLTLPPYLTSIGTYAFQGCQSLTSINIPTGVTEIPAYAFAYCYNLSSITIPSGVTRIGRVAFSGTEITEVILPAGLVELGDSAFGDCDGLVSITIPEGITKIEQRMFSGCDNLNNIEFQGDITEIGEAAFAGTAFTSFTIPSSVKTIVTDAFASCYNLKQIYFEGSAPEFVRGDYTNTITQFDRVVATAYYPCTNTSWVPSVMQDYGGDITWVGTCGNHDFTNPVNRYTWSDDLTTCSAGKYCSNTGCQVAVAGSEKRVTASAEVAKAATCTEDGIMMHTAVFNSPYETQIKETVISRTGHAYDREMATETYLFTAANCQSPAVYFKSCKCGETGAETFTYGDVSHSGGIEIKDQKTVTCREDGYTGDTWCLGCGNLIQAGTTVTAPGHAFVDGQCSACGVIGGYCGINGGRNLMWSLDNNGKLTIYGTGEMANYNKNPANGNSAPWREYTVKSVVVEEGATNIGVAAFYDMDITSVKLPASLKIISEFAFAETFYLKSVALPDGVTDIKDSAFSKGGLTTVEIPDSVTYLGTSAFEQTPLTSVTLPESITGIYSYTFSRTKLTSVVIPDSVTSIGNYAFDTCINLNSIVLSDNITNIGNTAFAGCKSLTSIVLPKNLKRINYDMFKNCTGLTSIYIPAVDASLTTFATAFGGVPTMKDIYFAGSAELWEAYRQYGTPPAANRMHYNVASFTDHWVTDIKTATCGTAGYSKETCACGYTRNEVIKPATGNHTYKNGICSACGASDNRCGESATWRIEGNALYIDGTGAIADYTSSTKVPWAAQAESIHEVYIAEGITQIGNYAFCVLPNLTQAFLPDSLTRIGEAGFAGSEKLAYLILPDGLKEIGAVAFAATGISYIQIPASVTTVGPNPLDGNKQKDVFYAGTQAQWDALNVYVPSSAYLHPNAVYSADHWETVEKESTCTQSGYTGRECDCGHTEYNSYTVPAHKFGADNICTVCGSKKPVAEGSCGANVIWRFDEDGTLTIAGVGKMDSNSSPWSAYQYDIKKVVVCNGVTSVGSNAFGFCTNLTEAWVGDDVTTIGAYAFSNCQKMKTLRIPAAVTSVGNDTLRRCDRLEDVYFGGTQTVWSGWSTGVPSDTRIHTDCADPDSHWNRNVTAATCTQDGLSRETCPCQFSRTVILPALGHNVALWTITKDATCVENGSRKGTCSRCGDLTEVIPATGHSFTDGSCSTCKLMGGFCGNDVQWVYENGILTVSGSGPMSDYSGDRPWAAYYEDIITVQIKAGVTKIGRSAFEDCSSLTEVMIPDGVISIGNYAFADCVKLIELTIPDSVTAIGGGLLYNCTGLTAVTIPAGVTSIGNYAFDGCSALKDVYYGGTSENWGALTNRPAGEDLLIHCECTSAEGHWETDTKDATCTEDGLSKKTCLCNYSRETVLPALGHDVAKWTVTKDTTCTEDGSRKGTCSRCGEQTEVIPAAGHDFIDNVCANCGQIGGYCGKTAEWSFDAKNGILTISGTGAMDDYYSADVPWIAYCENVQKAVIQNGITEIGDRAFRDCINMKEVSIADSVTSIARSAFANCSGLTKINIPASVISIETSVFWNCSSLTEISIPSGVTSIGGDTFYGCSSLTTISIPASVTSIGVEAFRGCSSLTEISIPASVTSVGMGAFWNCSSLTTISIPAGVTSIGSYAFYNCSSLTTISIPTGVTSIGKAAFHGCSGLTEIKIPAGVTSIGDYMFYGCSGLTEISIPTGVTSIGDHVFYGCSGLTELIIPANVTSIGNNAFTFCSGLTELNIPPNVTSIGSGAFSDCKNLTAVNIPLGITNIARETFAYCTALGKVVIPSGVTDIEDKAFFYCISLREITIPDSVTSIGNIAFASCNSLTDVYYGGTESQWTTLGDNRPTGEKLLIHYGCPTGDNHWKTETKSETCGTDGYTVERCSCKVPYERNKVIIPASGEHVYDRKLVDEKYLVSEATCTAQAEYYKSCICGDKGTETFKHGELDATNHAGGTEIRDVKAVSCMVDGYTGDTWCLGCQTKIADGETIGAPGHKYDQEKVHEDYLVKAATCTAQAEYYKSCACGEKGTETFFAGALNDANHKFVNDVCSCGTVKISETTFPDANFRAYITSQTYGEDSVLTSAELGKVTFIDVDNKNIKNLTGISYFTALKTLSCVTNQLTELDVSQNTALTNLYCYENQLTALDVSKNTLLTLLWCWDNQLTALDVSKNTALKDLSCRENQLTALDVSKNTALKNLSCGKNLLTALDVSKNAALTSLNCAENQLTSLDVSQSTALKDLSCGKNLLTRLDLSKSTLLTTLYCRDNQLTALDVSKNTALIDLSCGKNLLTALDVSKNAALTSLSCAENQLTELDVSKNTALKDLRCWGNRLAALDVSKNTLLTFLWCYGNQLTALDVSKNTALTDLSCTSNKRTVAATQNRFNLNELIADGFDISKASNWQGGTVDGNVLTATSKTVTFTYDLGNEKTATFTLAIDGFHKHTFAQKADEQYLVSAATCTSQAEYYKSCSVCGAEGTDTFKYGETLKHTYNKEKVHEDYLDKAATCTTQAEYYFSCTCGKKGTETFKHGELDANNHTGNNHTENAKTATCTEEGYTGDEVCECGATVKTGEAIEKENHSFNKKQGSLLAAGTCKTEAVYAVKCDNCTAETDEKTVKGEKNPANHVGGTEIRDAKDATCTVDGYTGDTYCLGCDTKIADGETIGAPGHKHEGVVTLPTCMGQGYTTYTCHCGDSYVGDYLNANGHSMGEWYTVREATPDADGEIRRDCDACDSYEIQSVPYQGNILKLEGEDLLSHSVVYINGLPYAIKGEGENRYVELSIEGDFYMVTYTYHVGDASDVHTQYPTGMKVYKVSGGKITYIPELDNLLQYSGSSIRITGKKGIRMITSLTKDTKAALTGNGLAGYKLLEYGTALCFASEVAGDGDLVLGKSYTRSNYAYKRGVADPVFATSGNLTQYTNVLVGFSLDQCKDDIAMRPYIILEDANGEQVTFYGGTIYRSIGYIAYQNRNVFRPKTASYNYVWEIIHHVYGDKYDADYKG